ncbi:YdbH domain-containing protein [Brevundimonas kwangchunensis]|uniref:YdbH domain-containing protein n=1 Tax=Brevundimonas kwangchunensis TaxID=322163 RepID=A0ABN1GLS2_9CAUL
MSDVAAAPSGPSSPRRGRGGRRLLRIVAVGLAVLLVLLAALWLNRRAAAREVLVGWLEREGVQADMDIERIELDGLVARIRIGDPANPDVTIERIEVDYALGAPWSAKGLGVTPSRVRLVRPVVRAALRDGELSFGSLDPLIDKFTGRPPQPDSRSPIVIVERARVRVDTDYGPVSVLGDARLDDGKLMRLVARMPAAPLRSGDIEARDLAATVDLTTTGDRVALTATASASSATLPGFSGQRIAASLTGDLPYPDMKTRRGDGVARLNTRLTAGEAALGETDLVDAALSLAFDGRTTGWIEAFDIRGTTDFALDAGRMTGPVGASGLSARIASAPVSLSRTATQPAIAWRADAPVTLRAAGLSGPLTGRDVSLSSSRVTIGGRGRAVEASGAVALSADSIGTGDLTLGQTRGTANVDLVADSGFRLTASGALRSGRASWPLFGAPARDDTPELAEMKRALSAFALDAPGFALVSGMSGTEVRLTQAVTARPANGGVLTIRPAATPVFSSRAGSSGGGALSLTATRGRGLPEAAFDIPEWRLTSSGFTARLDGRAALDFDLARGIAVQTRGRLTSAGGRLTYVADGCMPLTVERLDMDENDVTDIAGQVCPVARPLVEVRNGAWRADGALRGLSVSAPFLALRFADASGGFTATGGPRGIGLEARVERATVVDATTPARFNAMIADGSARLANEQWSGAFDLSRRDTVLGRLTLSHDGRAQAGGLTIDAPSITFAEGGLQPDDLSPLAGDIVGSPAVGSVAFQGRIDWRAETEGTSSGRLTIPGLDFNSPAGPVKGLRGAIDFTSLAPLETAPGQQLHIDLLESVAPLTDIDVTFGLDKSSVTVDGGELDVAGGVVRVEPFAVPLDRTKPITGVLVLENVQLGQVIAEAGFGDKVNLDAVVSGRLPYTYTPETGVRITGGSLQAVRPGRLSIQREALSGLEAGGGGEGVPPNTVQDLAYQAMENLSFDLLSAEVNSLDQGRLGVLFHIRGRHDPPQRQELRIPLAEFISRQFLNRQLPLPSDTGIDLTLETSLNLNQLVSDLLELNRARAGEARNEPEALP